MNRRTGGDSKWEKGVTCYNSLPRRVTYNWYIEENFQRYVSEIHDGILQIHWVLKWRGDVQIRVEICPNRRQLWCYDVDDDVAIPLCIIVAVSRGYDTCFSVKACDKLWQLLKSTASGWNTIRVSMDRVDLCQTHCVSRCLTFPALPEVARPRGQVLANSRRPVSPSSCLRVNMGSALAIVFQVQKE